MQTRLFLRLILKNPEIYFLKIITLAIAFVALILVSVFSLNEFGFDRFHENPEEVFRIIEKNSTETYGRNKKSSKISNDIFTSLNADESHTVVRTKVLNDVSILVNGNTIHNQQMQWSL